MIRPGSSGDFVQAISSIEAAVGALFKIARVVVVRWKLID
ncbi:hypothetical protein GFS60_01304 [Rhodococcus sp. WAY2]|nr:hypothetical protein GFS60_01304 [Rhodococcus sp. WAY2]